jgi:hypothetical protein
MGKSYGGAEGVAADAVHHAQQQREELPVLGGIVSGKRCYAELQAGSMAGVAPVRRGCPLLRYAPSSPFRDGSISIAVHLKALSLSHCSRDAHIVANSTMRIFRG